MLNVTHYDWTSKNIAYGRRVSRLVGGKPFVVSTSYNGRGPVSYTARSKKRVNVFCNPRFRGLGPAPTTKTGYDKVDAFLWLNRPGLSGAGACNGGPLPVGSWWPARALMFGRYATDWVSPQRRVAVRPDAAGVAVPARRAGVAAAGTARWRPRSGAADR